jgi:hypothetical protein
MDYIGAILSPTAEQQDASTIFPDGYTIGLYDFLAIKYTLLTYPPLCGYLIGSRVDGAHDHHSLGMGTSM